MSFSQSSALKCASAVLAATMLGCGPRDGSKEFRAGKEAYELRDLKRAEKFFERSVVLAPQDVDRLLYLARTELELGELERRSPSSNERPRTRRGMWTSRFSNRRSPGI